MIRRLWTFAVEHSLLLLAGATAGLVWANVDLDTDDQVVHAMHFVVNDIGMTFFFGLAAKEVVEATAPMVRSTHRDGPRCRCSPPSAA